MREEKFGTQREFKKKFPSGIYICPRCKNITTNPYFCTNCNNQVNNFIFRDVYKYKIEETGTEDTIFKPIEILKTDSGE